MTNKLMKMVQRNLPQLAVSSHDLYSRIAGTQPLPGKQAMIIILVSGRITPDAGLFHFFTEIVNPVPGMIGEFVRLLLGYPVFDLFTDKDRGARFFYRSHLLNIFLINCFVECRSFLLSISKEDLGS